ncbi:TFIID-18kDa-domain-containing protein [Pleomassaria siparia CBS 279.74]|uniref:TFIID-18kDa-domain-containing protein n=1 Tax=Pleomassaria siparia CBS 279.74 TaxID=1314801 RepID=A0A6G1KJ93_9PLEO|nr:TFIID-18kDa-domain-containing protein [Pleomassaria siparia CBS 279.74]
MADKGPSFHVEIAQMLFIAGETTEPSITTTHLIERIVQHQVIEIFTRASALATRRGTRYITNEDIIFIVRHDAAKVSRLRTFLAWKDVRKNLKDDDDKANPEAVDITAPENNPAAVEEAGTTNAAAAGAKKSKKKSALPWDVSSFFSVQVPELGGEDDEDDDGEGADDETRRRLRINDERTLNMTREEYAVWAECRQASFTWRKAKRFKEWACLADVHEGARVAEDVIDIMGFLTAEMVQKLGEGARKVFDEEDAGIRAKGKGKMEDRNKGGCGLFAPNEGTRRPIEVRHVQEAYRKLQMSSNRTKAFSGPSRMVSKLIEQISRFAGV